MAELFPQARELSSHDGLVRGKMVVEDTLVLLPTGVVEPESGDLLRITAGPDGTLRINGLALSDSPHTHIISDVFGLQGALDAKLDDVLLNQPNGVAGLDADGNYITARMPALTPTETYVLALQSEMLALTSVQAPVGTLVKLTGSGETWIRRAITDGTIADWVELTTTADVTSVAGKTGPVTLVITDIIGLAAALAGKANSTHIHAIADVSSLQASLDAKADAADLATEITDRTAADGALDARLDTAETALAGKAEASDLIDEASTRASADTALDGRLDTVETALPDKADAADLATEITDRTDADAALDGRLDTVETALPTKAAAADLATEASTRAADDAALDGRLDTVEAALPTKATAADLTAETTARTSADTALTTSLATKATAADLTTEISARTSAVSAEATARANADTAEASARAAADSALDARVTANTTNLWLPPSQDAPKHKETMISTFQSGHGWALQGTLPAGSTITDDTSDYMLGSQSLAVLTDGVGGVTQVQLALGAALDMTGKDLKMWVKVSDASKISDLAFYLSDGVGFTNFYFGRLQPTTVPSPLYLTANDWIPLTINFGDLTATGTPNRAAITHIRLRFKDRGTGAFTARYNMLATIPQPTAGVISFTFDDGWLTQYTAAKPLLDKYGYKATFYNIVSLQTDPLYMTAAQLKTLDAQGHEIASHANTLANHNAPFTALTQAVLEQDFRDMRQTLMGQGFKGTEHLALPSGAYNQTVLDVTKRYFRSSRTIYGANSLPLETVIPANPYKLRAWSVTNSDTLANVQAACLKAINNKSWAIFVFHKIVTTPAISTEWSIANMTSLIDYINTNGGTVKPVGQVIAGL